MILTPTMCVNYRLLAFKVVFAFSDTQCVCLILIIQFVSAILRLCLPPAGLGGGPHPAQDNQGVLGAGGAVGEFGPDQYGQEHASARASRRTRSSREPGRSRRRTCSSAARKGSLEVGPPIHPQVPRLGERSGVGIETRTGREASLLPDRAGGTQV